MEPVSQHCWIVKITAQRYEEALPHNTKLLFNVCHEIIVGMRYLQTVELIYQKQLSRNFI